jgi:hypothetical protein
MTRKEALSAARRTCERERAISSYRCARPRVDVYRYRFMYSRAAGSQSARRHPHTTEKDEGVDRVSRRQVKRPWRLGVGSRPDHLRRRFDHVMCVTPSFRLRRILPKKHNHPQNA